MSALTWDYKGVGAAKSHYRATPGPVVPLSDCSSPTTPTSPDVPNLSFSSVSSVASSSSYTLASPVTPRTLPGVSSPLSLSRKGKGREMPSAMDLAVRLSRAPSEGSSENPFAFDEIRLTPTPPPDGSDARPVSCFSSDSGSSLDTPTLASTASKRRSSQLAPRSPVQFSYPPRRSLPATARKPTLPVQLAGPSHRPSATATSARSVQVVMTGTDSLELQWSAGDVKWLVPARVHFQPQQVVLDFHPSTPPDERQWLIKSALEMYEPMRFHRQHAEAILRASFPGLPIHLDSSLAPAKGMRRSTFTRREPVPDDSTSDLDLRLVVSDPPRNAFRLSQRLSGPHEDVWIPSGVEFDVTHNKIDTSSPIDSAKSTTLQRILLHALRRIAGTSRRLGIDVQRSVARADLRRMSFDPRAVQVKPRGYGIVDLTIPDTEGVRVYSSTNGHVLEHANEPEWRVAELEMFVSEFMGTDPSATPLSLPQLRAGYVRTPIAPVPE